MSLNAIYLLDHKGKPLISRCYKGPLPYKVIDKFISLLKSTEEKLQCAPPILTFQTSDFGVYYLYVKHGNIFGIILFFY